MHVDERFGPAPGGGAGRRRTRRRPAGVGVLLVVVAGLGPAACGGGGGADEGAGPTGAAPTGAAGVVPELRGLEVGAAADALDAGGVELAVEAGDPGDPTAVVVAQEPPAGTAAGAGDAVGVRTALVTAEVCEALGSLVPRTGDALELAARPGYAGALRAAEPAAAGPLRSDLATVLAAIDAGDDLARAPGFVQRGLDRIAVHVDACALD